MQSQLASRWPKLGRAFNFFPAEASRQLLESKLLERFVEQSTCSMPADRVDFLQAHGALEQSRYPLPITLKGRAEISFYRLGPCYVLGHSGSTVLIEVGAQIQSIARNTTKFQRLVTRKVEGLVINRLGMRRGHKHYYHFIMDGLYPLLVALERHAHRFDAITVLVRPDLASYQLAAYAHLTSLYPQLRLEVVEERERIVCDELLHIDEAQNCEYRAPFSERAIEKLAATFRAAYGIVPSGRPHRRLYLSRKDAKIRHILNENELILRLTMLGFEVVCPGEMDHATQVRTFSEAEMIVSAHGAALSNLVFTQAGRCHVVELFSSDYIQSAYMWLATLKGHRYTPLICEEGQSHQHFEVPHQVVEELDALLETELT
ncbi:glycosyltransferase family 61 protein [Pseudovibrio exalbescens]|uniref:glycosyltransferase family 61 protein n=1 Tax=Pseudovibrio exalbescens TaxID=197461 RepID=UPI0023656821|nr:glycosyltransferase family 61 protein [Pseudovibrio exalbescens]MDD7911277.1 glycosyltransferase family 61 protein [Pseudovibrio exalbescens]